MTDKKDQEENLKQFIQKYSIKKEGITKAPPPIAPLSSHGVILSRPPKTEPQKELSLPITGSDLMKRWSIDFAALLHFAREGILCPYVPENFKDHVRFDFDFLTDNPDERASYFSKWLYRKSVIEDFELNHKDLLKELEQSIAPAPTAPPEQTDPEALIRSVSISYLSDTEVSIKVGDKEAKNYTCEKMGFKSSENGWKLLMEVLKDRNHLFDAGTYSKDRISEKNKRYNQRQKWIPQFTKKFITFLNSECPVRIPYKTKLLENQKKKDRDGLYKPTFQVASNDTIHNTDIKKMSKEAVLKKIKTLANDRKQEKNAEVGDSLLLDIGRYVQHAAKNGWMTNEQARKMISLPDEDVASDDVMSLVDQRDDINDR